MNYHKSFIIYGNPVPKARARVVRSRGNFGKFHAFTPQKTVDWEQSVAGQTLKYKPDELLTGAIKVGLKFYKSPLKSFSKKKREMALNNQIRPVSKPDLDNFVKLILDSLRGIIWKDDSQIVEYLQGTGKYYGDPPRVEIEIMEV